MSNPSKCPYREERKAHKKSLPRKQPWGSNIKKTAPIRCKPAFPIPPDGGKVVARPRETGAAQFQAFRMMLPLAKAIVHLGRSSPSVKSKT